MRNAFRKTTAVAGLALAVLGQAAPAGAFQPVGSYLLMKQEPVATITPSTFPIQAPLPRPAGRATVDMPGRYEAGTILVVNAERKLYLSVGDGQAIVYPIAIGKPGMSWTGETSVTAKVRNPTWTPTPNTRRMKPDLPAFVAAGPNNPLGPRALYLGRGYYRIHGTNKPDSIGSAASLGCFRMHNVDVIDLFQRVEPGAKVIVVDRAPPPAPPAGSV